MHNPFFPHLTNNCTKLIFRPKLKSCFSKLLKEVLRNNFLSPSVNDFVLLLCLLVLCTSKAFVKYTLVFSQIVFLQSTELINRQHLQLDFVHCYLDFFGGHLYLTIQISEKYRAAMQYHIDYIFTQLANYLNQF